MTRPASTKLRPAWLLLLACLCAVTPACTSPETYYRDDGSPYTVNQFDAGETILTVILVGATVSAIAASKEDGKP